MSAKTAPLEEVPQEGVDAEASAADVVSAAGAAEASAAGEEAASGRSGRLHSRPIQQRAPTAQGASFTTVPVAGGGISYPDSEHADLNLSLRGYSPTDVSCCPV